MAAIDDGKNDGRDGSPDEGVVLSKIPIVASSDAELKSSVASTEPNWARRSFILQGIVGTTSLALSSLALLTSHKALLNSDRILDNSDRVREEVEGRKSKQRQDMVFDLLFGESKRQFYVPSFDNPYAPLPPGSMTAPTADALKSIFDHVGFESRHIQELKETHPSKIDGSILLLGGPVPNKLSRAILGKGHGSPLFLHALGKRIDLPVHFANYLGDKLGPGNRPKYRIVVNGSSLQVAEEGIDDFLVITSIPNVCSVNFETFKHRLVNVAGFHGGGMRAIDLVLEDEFLPKLYKQLSESPKLKGAPAWQALLRIEVDANNKSHPRRIVDFATYRIKMDEDEFAKVRGHVSRTGIRIES
jgi:hypothetical protein